MWNGLFSFVIILLVTSYVYTQDPTDPPTLPPPTQPPPTEPPPTQPPPTQPPPTLPPTTIPPKYSVSVVDSNVPNSDFEIDAVGALQLGLETHATWPEALDYLYQVFQTRHDTHQWKLSSGCTYLMLPKTLTYITLEEKYTGTISTIFE